MVAKGADLKQISITESGRYHQCKVYLNREGAIWLGRCVIENIPREKEQAFVRMRGENEKTYVIRRGNNNYGRYIEATEGGRGGW